MGNEITRKREMNKKFYDLGEGKIGAEVFSHPVHYKSENDEWEDINLDLCDCDKWEFTGEVTSNVYRSYFGDSTVQNRHLASVEFIDDEREMWINFKLKDANPIEMVKNGNKCVFSECFPNIDVEYIILPEKLKENIILKEQTNLREFVFTLKHDGVNLTKENNGSIIISNKNTGSTVWTISKPFMEDADKNKSYGVSYELGNDGEFDTLSVVIEDEDFLNSAKYPIIIDPTTEIQPDSTVTKDTYIDQYSWNTGNNYNGDDILFCGYYISDPYRHVYIDVPNPFNKDEISIQKAKIILYVDQESDNRREFPVAYYKVNEPWDVNEITGSNHPSHGDRIEEIPIDPNRDVYEWDITSIISDEDYYGIRISPLGSIHGQPQIFFVSSENEIIDRRPKLYIEYLQKPTLGFHDGNIPGGYYSDSAGEIFKYLDFGVLVAGQTSLVQPVYLRNLSGFSIYNLQLYVDENEFPDNTVVELSSTNNPFIGEDRINIDGTIEDDEDVVFYVRVSTSEEANAGGDFKIYAKAVPM